MSAEQASRMGMRAIFSGSVCLSLGTAVGAGCQFLRTMIVARIITREDFGIAAIFALTAAFCDMISNMNTEKLLIQAQDGDEVAFQRSAQALEVLRGVVLAVVLLVAAGPVSMWFNMAQAEWGFRLLALIPLIRGMRHFDIQRIQRHMRFGPFVIVDTGAQVLSVVLAWPTAVWFPDYTAMLYLLLAQEIFRTAGSHLLRLRPYRWGWDSGYLRRILSFGWPLLLNGVFMFLIFQGDKVVIGSSAQLFAGAGYNIGELGLYSMAFLMTSQPVAMISRVASYLMLPSFSLARGQHDVLVVGYRRAYCGLSIFSAWMAFGCILIGGPLVVLLLGDKYAGASVLIGWLGVMQSLRILRDAPTMATIALGDTRSTMIATGIRTLALFGALAVSAMQMPLVWIAVCGTAGEVAALGTIVVLARLWHGIPYASALTSLAIVLAAAGIATVLTFAGLTLPINAVIFICIAMAIAAGACRVGCIPMREILGGFIQRKSLA